MSRKTHPICSQSLHPQATIATLTVKLVTSMGSNPYTRPAACVCDNSPGTRQRHFPQSPCGGETLSSICSLTTVTPTVTRDTQNHHEQQLSTYGFHTSSSTSYKVLKSFFMQTGSKNVWSHQCIICHFPAAWEDICHSRAEWSTKCQKLRVISIWGVNFCITHSVALHNKSFNTCRKIRGKAKTFNNAQQIQHI